ncbi:hypothetical protein DRJ16_05195 [Candidatus Woesearchaeota archaeon]|nr:MAG: hypothetical protein DRJ16_05195 [Candidatus Woesearchaeota archaeon]
MKVKVIALTVLLVIVAFSLGSEIVYAVDEGPQIRVYPPPSRNFPLRIYIEPKDLDLSNHEYFICPSHDRIVQTFYEVERTFLKSLSRFVDEYPEYAILGQVYFINATDRSDADIVLEVVRGINYSRAVVLYGGGVGVEAYRLQIVCWEGERYGDIELFNVIMHEFLHTLGLGHAKQQYTSLGEVEVMRDVISDYITYPTTLDFYGLYQTYFGELSYTENTLVELPSSIRYEMVVPYDIEIEELRLENKNLRHQIDLMATQIDELTRDLKNVTESVKRLDVENRRLADQNKALKERLLDLEDQLTQLKTLKKDLEEQLAQARAEVSRLQEDVKALQALNNKLQLANQNLKDENSLLESQNQVLRRELQQANQAILALSVLTVCLIAITIAVITFRRRG